ncbi:putative ABC transport system ATP-binding protein [Planomicrobium sp. HSC-17F08]|nr:putative ABC transport system ATP-binding protein [Planomicrobium sp. HSC-17F08]
MIHLEFVEKHYSLAKEQVKVLKNIHLRIDQGEFVAIMGPSGSGKSTVMNIIGCLDKPSEGKYWLNGQLITDYEEKELASIRNRSMGFVFQHFNLLPRLNALQNVALPMVYAGVKQKARNKRAAEVLGKLGLKDRMKHLPNELSGGQKQRVAIARAIVNKPQIILADEPTGALDTKTGRQIMDLFKVLHQDGTTIVLITHEQEVAAYADRIIFVRDGIITGDEAGKD